MTRRSRSASSRSDGGESVRTSVGRLGDGGESGMFCLRKFWLVWSWLRVKIALHRAVVPSHQVQSLLEALVSARLSRGRARTNL